MVPSVHNLKRRSGNYCATRTWLFILTKVPGTGARALHLHCKEQFLRHFDLRSHRISSPGMFSSRANSVLVLPMTADIITVLPISFSSEKKQLRHPETTAEGCTSAPRLNSTFELVPLEGQPTRPLGSGSRACCAVSH